MGNEHRIFITSVLASRLRDELAGYPPRTQLQSVHYAHMRAAGTQEQAKADELQSARERYPESEGWAQHDVTLSEVTGNFNAALIVADNVAVTPVFTVRTIGEVEEKQPEMIETPDLAM